MKTNDAVATSRRITLDEIGDRLKKIEDLLDALADRKFHKIVTVVPGTWGKRCRAARGCRRKPKFMLFGDDGKPKSSRLACVTCELHLPKAVKRLHERQAGGRKDRCR